MIPKLGPRHLPSTHHACATTDSSGAALRDCVESFRVLAEAHPEFACELRELTVASLLDGWSEPAPQWVAGAHSDIQALVAQLSITSHAFQNLDPGEKWDLVDLALQELPRSATSPARNTCYMNAAIHLIAATPELQRIVTTSEDVAKPMRDAWSKSPARLDDLYSEMVDHYGAQISTAMNEPGDTADLLNAVFKDKLLQVPASALPEARYDHPEPGIVLADHGTKIVDVFETNAERATGVLIHFGRGDRPHYVAATKNPAGHWFLWNGGSATPIADIKKYLEKNEDFVVGLMLDQRVFDHPPPAALASLSTMV